MNNIVQIIFFQLQFIIIILKLIFQQHLQIQTINNIIIIYSNNNHYIIILRYLVAL